MDNDPDSRGPCRLLHIVQGGDYGYRFRNGRKGLHPFTSWNGELPGTLPMVAGTAEAPSGILAYESNGFPAEYRGKLFVTSWGDHVIDAFTLMPRGASFGAKQQTLVRGGENFRPVGIVAGARRQRLCQRLGGQVVPGAWQGRDLAHSPEGAGEGRWPARVQRGGQIDAG